MDFILNPFVTILILLYQLLFENVVLAIIVFTVLVRVATYPLTMQQQRSMKAQQEMAPKLRKLQEKYKDDREKLAQAQMEMYREAGINPLGGCLPLIIQLPILIGLYQAIIQSLAATPLQLMDLYGRVLLPGLDVRIPLQNQFLWLNLAQPDPLYVLPILVLITSFIQQRLITPPTDPNDKSQTAQMTRSMTTFMPIMFFFFALNFASGLSIYFVVSNLIGVAQYSAMGRANWDNLLSFLRRGNRTTPGTVEGEATEVDSDQDSSKKKSGSKKGTSKAKTSKAK